MDGSRPIRKVLALDLAQWTGCAVDGPGEAHVPLLWTLRLPKTPDEVYGPRYVALADALDETIRVHRPDVLVFEAPLAGGHLPGGATTKQPLFGYAAIAEMLGTRHGLDVRQESVQTVRKAFVGNGFAKKAEVMRRVEMLGWTVDNHNESDAAALWWCQHHWLRQRHLTGQTDLVMARQHAGRRAGR